MGSAWIGEAIEGRAVALAKWFVRRFSLLLSPMPVVSLSVSEARTDSLFHFRRGSLQVRCGSGILGEIGGFFKFSVDRSGCGH